MSEIEEKELPTQGTETPDKPTKMQRIMSNTSSFGRRLRLSISKTFVNTKVSAMHRFSHADYTQEEPDIVAALRLLKSTKRDITAFAQIARRLYDSLQEHIQVQTEYESTLQVISQQNSDEFGNFLGEMEKVDHDLQRQRKRQAQLFQEKVLEPLEHFEFHDIEASEKMKLEYKQIKAQYDVALHDYLELSNKENSKPEKLNQASSRKTEMENSLKSARDKLRESIKTMEDKKEKELLKNLREFWSSFKEFHIEAAKIFSNAHLMNGNEMVVDPEITLQVNERPEAGNFVDTVRSTDEGNPIILSPFADTPVKNDGVTDK